MLVIRLTVKRSTVDEPSQRPDLCADRIVIDRLTRYVNPLSETNFQVDRCMLSVSSLGLSK